MLDLTFIIPVYNTGLDLVAQCFDTVASQQTDYSYEVIVIDDGSAENYAVSGTSESKTAVFPTLETSVFERLWVSLCRSWTPMI
jgi:cellulose synthase/poly-beta-1,6-N-acetylglucosamine synthase-like glycosyltransferase